MTTQSKTPRYRHRVDLPATVSLDIVTDSRELSAAQVEALLTAHFNFDEGNGLDYAILDGYMARLFLPVDQRTAEWTKQFESTDVIEAGDDDALDVIACAGCPGLLCDKCSGLGFYHDSNELMEKPE